MKNRKKYMAVLLAGCMMVSNAVPTAAANEQEVKEKKAEIQSQINSKKAAISSLNKKKKQVMSTIRELDEKHTKAQEKLVSLNDQIEKKTGEIEVNTENLKVAREDAKKQYADMKKRIQYMYESGDKSMIVSLLESGSFAEVLNKAEFFQKMTSFDRDKLEEFKATCKKIEDLEVKLEKEKSDLEGYKKSAEEEKVNIETAITQKQSEIASFEAGIDAAMAEQADLEGDLAVQNEILKQMKEEIKNAGDKNQGGGDKGNSKPGSDNKPDKGEGSSKPDKGDDNSKPDKGEEPSKPDKGDDNSKPDNGNGNSKPDNGGGSSDNSQGGSKPSIGRKLSWPCPSSHRVTSPFGPRKSPTAGASSNHRGIDIGAGTGSAITAAASGTVTAATYSESAGNYVTISHGKGVSTVYMHATELYVKKGDKVSTGQKIAAVGSTGYSTGPHLHFGVTVNGTYVNPMDCF